MLISFNAGVVSIKKFIIIWISQAFSLFGSTVVEFALAWYLTIETGSATVLATAVLVSLLPQIVLGPLIGAFIDRWDRKLIMILADLSISIITVGLIISFAVGAIQIWQIYLAMILRAIGQSFHYPAVMAAVPMIVPEKHLSRANGMNQMLFGMVTVAGPPAGAFLFGMLPVQGVLMVDIVTAVIAIGCLLPIFIPQPVSESRAGKTSVLSEIMEALRYIWNWRGLRVLIILYAVLTFFLLPPFMLMPILVTEHVGGDVLKLGWLQSAFGLGMIAGGLILGVWGGFKRRIITCLMGILIASLATLTMGFTSTGLFFLGLVSSFLIGGGISIADGPIMASLQAMVPKDIQGRIFSLINSISSAITPLGLAFAGPLADAIGIQAIYFIAGAATLVAGIASFFIRPLMELERKTAEP